METLDLSLLDAGPPGRAQLAAAFDRAVVGRRGIRLDNHGLDTELLELAAVFRRRILAHAELREVFVEQQRSMRGVAYRLLSVAGVALGLGANHFADRLVREPRTGLMLEEPAGGGSLPQRGLLAMRQDSSGTVTAWIGPQMARLSASRWVPTALPPPEPNRPSLRLDLDGHSSIRRAGAHPTAHDGMDFPHSGSRPARPAQSAPLWGRDESSFRASRQLPYSR